MYIYKQEDYGQLERIKELMDNTIDPDNGKKGITQEKLAFLIEVDKSNVNKWFKKGVKIRKSNLIKIADKLNCDVEFLTCEQDYPRKSNPSKFKLSAPTFTEKYLKKLEELMQTTPSRFSFRIGWDIVGGEVYSGTFVDGQTKYYYEDIEPEYGKMYYEISINGGEYKKKTPEEMEDFVKSIMKYISYEINQL